MDPGTDTSNDPVAQFFNGEHRGRVRGFGQGVTPLGLHLHVHSEPSRQDRDMERFRAQVEADMIRRDKVEAELRSQMENLTQMFSQYTGSSSHAGPPGPTVEPPVGLLIELYIDVIIL